MQCGADFSIKGKSLHPTALISYLSSHIDYKKFALKKIIILLSSAAMLSCYTGVGFQ